MLTSAFPPQSNLPRCHLTSQHMHLGCFAGHSKWVWDCVFSVDAAYLVTASSDCTARLWDLSSGEAIRVYSGHHKVWFEKNNAALSVVWKRDIQLASVGIPATTTWRSASLRVEVYPQSRSNQELPLMVHHHSSSCFSCYRRAGNVCTSAWCRLWWRAL